MTVRYHARAREIVSYREEVLNIGHSMTVIDVLKILVTKHGDELKEYLFDANSDSPRQHLRFLLNGQSVSTTEKLPSEDSVLLIFPPTAGG